MASKRPSTTSILARQRNIIEGMGTRDLTYTQAAKEFGVTRQQYKSFIEAKPRNLRYSYNRSPAYQKLYREGERKETRRVLGVKRITRYERKRPIQYVPPKTPQEVKRRQIEAMVQHLYYKNGAESVSWANQQRERGQPSSIDVIVLLHDNGKMSDTDYVNAIHRWARTYNVNEARVDSYLEDLEEVA